ncbi:MAG: hypothetical protein MUC88_08495 [Planctomycetes bacterium]|jgi:hypothetical protein|nr:hypothetical protein [Planctomycetota bacterium]
MNTTALEITRGRRLVRFCLSVSAGLLALGLATAVAVMEWGYYGLPPAERPFHVYHDLLRPSGHAGLPCGVVATTLFVLNLGYLIRKRLIHFRWLGSRRTWMSFHAVTGIAGGALVALHAAFRSTSALGVLALIALAITVASGVIGRYLYAKVPRSLEGRELEIEQVRERLHAYRHQLEDAGVSTDWLRPRVPEGPGSSAEPVGSPAIALRRRPSEPSRLPTAATRRPGSTRAACFGGSPSPAGPRVLSTPALADALS